MVNKIGHIVNRTCPQCGGELVVGPTGRRLVCPRRECWANHGKRAYIEPLPEDLAMRLAGQPELPLFALVGVA